MVEEENKAINNLWSSVTDVMFNVLYSQEDLQKDLKIALNLMQKQQKEIEKKDKMIDEAKQYCEKIMNYEEYEKKHSKLSREIIKIKEGLTTHYKVWRIANNIHNILLTRY